MDPILDIQGLEIVYKTQDGTAHALNKVDLSLVKGMALGLVGETGAGKTTLAKGIMRLIQSPPGVIENGTVFYRGKDLYEMDNEEMRQIHGKEISMVFQDPMTSLNPVMTVGEQIAEAVCAHQKVSQSDALKRAEEMLELVGIPGERINDYPHQFSGGMKQRVVIAIALTCDPAVLIADEPTTALDVTIQAQVLDLMKSLRQRFNTAMLLITHDLGVVAQTCDHVAVIYAGEIMEYGTVFEIFEEMAHPYTIGLFKSIPNLKVDVKRLTPIKGMMPDPYALPSGCKFSTRCPYAADECFDEHPSMTRVSGEHTVRCFRYKEAMSMKGNADGQR